MDQPNELIQRFTKTEQERLICTKETYVDIADRVKVSEVGNDDYLQAA